MDKWRKVVTVDETADDCFDPGAVPQLQWIAIKDLVIDDEYQRPLERGNWKAVRTIAKNFRWSQFSPVFVAPVEGGLFAIIDGQHRTHAAAARGIKQVPCQVVPMSRQEQASAFAAVNGTVTKVTVFQIYKAALAAGEPWAVTARDIALEGGCQLMTSNSSTSHKKPGQIFGVRAFCDLVEKYDRAVLVSALQTLMATEGFCDMMEMWDTSLLRPLLHALCQRPNALQRDGFNEALSGLDLWKMQDRITAENRMRQRAGEVCIGRIYQMETGVIDWIDTHFPERMAFPGSAA